MIEWLAENYTPLELAELLVLALRERDAARDLVPGDGLCAGGYENESVEQEGWPTYPQAEEVWYR